MLPADPDVPRPEHFEGDGSRVDQVPDFVGKESEAFILASGLVNESMACVLAHIP